MKLLHRRTVQVGVGRGTITGASGSETVSGHLTENKKDLLKLIKST